MSLQKKKLTRNQKNDVISEIHDYDIIIDTREIFINGLMNESDAGIDHRTANRFVKNLKLLESLKPDELIVVYQHSIGGEWWSGMMMYDAIDNCQCPILFITTGEASSMASIIPLAADKVVTTPNCAWLVHEGYTGIGGGMTMRQTNSLHILEQEAKERMLDIYANACQYGQYYCDNSYSIEEIKEFIKSKMTLKEDWYLTAREAVKYGFAEAILGDEGYETVQTIKQNWYNYEEEDES